MLLAVEARGIVKRFGRKLALRGVDLEVRRGEVFGVVGPNGAGKTTLLRIIATLVKPTAGSLRVMGIDAIENPAEVRKVIGYLPEEADVYPRLTGWENLLFYARLVTGSEAEARKLARLGAEISGLGDALRRKAGTYSRGMRRRLLLARTLMLRPQLAILDEPTSGLDVFSAIGVRRAIARYVREEGATVILSSHNMLEVEYLCSRVALINNGVIVALGTPEEIKEMANAPNLEEAFLKLLGGGVGEG
ncbi:MAG: multidrug ABC transporter ATP-binding protein [Thermoprotei archaeon]|nr:MAG: multidrug ABC transporter ATP-binding protein [Thermoprotei archaeon]